MRTIIAAYWDAYSLTPDDGQSRSEVTQNWSEFLVIFLLVNRESLNFEDDENSAIFSLSFSSFV